jgi:hypothetical protein
MSNNSKRDARDARGETQSEGRERGEAKQAAQCSAAWKTKTNSIFTFSSLPATALK